MQCELFNVQFRREMRTRTRVSFSRSMRQVQTAPFRTTV